MWWLVPIVIVIFVLNIVLPKRYNSISMEWKINKIPGPPRIPYLGNALLFAKVRHRGLLKLLIDLANEYGPVFRVEVLGLCTVFCTDVACLEKILNSRKQITKSYDYRSLIPWLGTGLLTSTGKKWADHRKWLTPAFHFGILEQYIDIFNKNANILVEKIKAYGEDEIVEINPLIALCTLDIICETAMGTQVNAQFGGEEEYVKATIKMSQISRIRTLTPHMHYDWVFKLLPAGREQRKVLRILHGFSNKVIKERKEAFKQSQISKNAGKANCPDEKGKKKISFLDLLIEMSETENKMTEEEIREEVDTFMFEGHDTTSAALCWALFELGSHPDVQEKVYQELEEIFGDSDRFPTTADLAEMKYLERVIKETLRLYPSVPIMSRELQEDIKIKDYVIPAGCDFPIFTYYIHRDPRFYPEPEKFDPDRFLPEIIQGRHPYSYIPFSAGPRNCIGQKFAMMEVKVLLSQIIRNFELTSLDKREEINLLVELILRPEENLRMLFKPRKNIGKV